LALTYFTTASEIGELHLGSITLSNQAQGTVRFIATASPEGGPKVEFSGTIIDGILPEPTVVSMLVLGAAGMLPRRKS